MSDDDLEDDIDEGEDEDEDEDEELLAPDGTPIKGVLTRYTGIMEVTDLRRFQNGNLEWENSGADVDYNSEEYVTSEDGQTIFEDNGGDYWKGSDLVTRRNVTNSREKRWRGNPFTGKSDSDTPAASSRLADLLNRYGRAKFGSDWAPENAAAWLDGPDGHELEKLFRND